MIKAGKTKDVFETSDPQVMLLRFKDDVTGKDGQFDPGENKVALSIDGMGILNLLVSQLFFEKIEEMDDTPLQKNGYVTHYIDTDMLKGTMRVRRATMFGNGLELVLRYRATGSFIRRYGMYAADGDLLEQATVEFTLKDDERGDPLINRNVLETLGILRPAGDGGRLSEYEVLVHWTRKIAGYVRDILSKRGLELWDIKLEFGRDLDGEVMLIDEISAGSMRVFKDGVHVKDPVELSKLILG